MAPVAPLGVSLIPWGAQGPPYGVSMSWFIFIHLVIVLLLLSLLLSRLAFVAPVRARGDPSIQRGPIHRNVDQQTCILIMNYNVYINMCKL
jgi:hypothetical protein